MFAYAWNAIKEHPSYGLTLLLAGGAFIVSIVAACFSYGQWKAATWQAHVAEQTRLDMQTAGAAQAKDVERSRKAAEDSARAAQRNADAANRSANSSESSTRIAERQLGTAIESLVAQHRPLLEITAFKFQNKNVLFLDAKNSGHSPALNIKYVNEFDVGQVAFTKAMKAPTFLVAKTISSHGFFETPDVPTNGPTTIGAYIPAYDELRKDAEFLDQMDIRIRGTVEYCDDGKRHRYELKFCYIAFHPALSDIPMAMPCYGMMPQAK